MKNALLTALLIAAAVGSGDLLAQATVSKTPATRAAAAVADRASFDTGRANRVDLRQRLSVASVDSATTAAK